MTWRRGEAGSTLIDRPNDDPVPDFHECQGKGYRLCTGRGFKQKMLATVAIHRREWQKKIFYTDVIVKLAQLIDVFMQNEELLCSKL